MMVDKINKEEAKELRKKQLLKKQFYKPNVKDFVDTYFIKETNHPIRKDEFFRYFNTINNSKVPWGWLSNELNKLGIRYNNNCHLSNGTFGCVIGLNYKDDILGLSLYNDFIPTD